MTFTTTDIFVLQGYPKKLSSTLVELQYIVVFPTVSNQSRSSVLEIRTTRNSLEFSKIYISVQLGVTLVETKIVQLSDLKQPLPEPGKDASVWIYVGIGVGVPMLVALLVSSILCCMR